MGKLTWSWAQVRAGQIITFRYNQQERVVIVMMSPKDPSSRDKNLLHGLQIVGKGIGVTGMKTQLPLLIKKSGGIRLILEDNRTGKYFKFNMGFEAEDKTKPDIVYSQIKSLISSKDLYKTFSWEKCTSVGVKLNNDELNEYNIPLDMLADAGVLPSEKKPKVKPRPKTFKRNQRKARYKPGDVWKQAGGLWAAKSLDKKIRSYKTRDEAVFWSKSTESSRKVRQINLAIRKSKKDMEDEV